MARVIGTRQRKARKFHRCHHCEKLIKPGEYYTTCTNADGPYIFDLKTCRRCASYVNEFYKYIGGADYSLDDFTEWMYDNYPVVLQNWRKERKWHD